TQLVDPAAAALNLVGAGISELRVLHDAFPDAGPTEHPGLLLLRSPFLLPGRVFHPLGEPFQRHPRASAGPTPQRGRPLFVPLAPRPGNCLPGLQREPLYRPLPRPSGTGDAVAQPPAEDHVRVLADEHAQQCLSSLQQAGHPPRSVSALAEGAGWTVLVALF